MEVLLINLLAPLLGDLLSAGREAASDAIERVGSGAWGRIKELWSKLWPEVEGNEGAKKAAEAVAANPDDSAARGALEFQLRDLLKSNPDLQQELKAIVEDGQRAGVFADNGAVVVTGGISADRGGIVVMGDAHGNVEGGWRGD